MTTTPIFYSDLYLSDCQFDTTRKAKWVADSLVKAPISGISVHAPPLVSWSALKLAHSPEYIDAVRNGRPVHLAESSGLQWDKSTPMACLASTSGVVAAAMTALNTSGVAGSLSSGLHHAGINNGSGFCTFNGLAVAAKMANDIGARVLILDFDAHCGGGTFEILGSDHRFSMVDISTCEFDAYVETENAVLDVVRSADSYLPLIELALSLVNTDLVDLVIYNAGMDPHEDCDIGGMAGITTRVLRDRERMVFDWADSADIPLAFVLAGGYTGEWLSQEKLVDLHRLTITAAAAG